MRHRVAGMSPHMGVGQDTTGFARGAPWVGTVTVQKREIFGWVLFDFADSTFATTILAVIFNQYFATGVTWELGSHIFICHAFLDRKL